jgi:phosphatidylserine/phosphatidylglycerophosphate/cardiolipin synthase-like enzyme
MSARSGSSPIRTILAIVVVLASSVIFFQSTHKSQSESGFQLPHSTAEAGVAQAEQHYSPLENLEQLDRERLAGAQHTVDIAMYAFTDHLLAEELIKLGRRGVQVRLYRDREQYEEEQQRNRVTTTDMLRGQSGIEIRVKAGRELMHLKAYVIDGSLLRDGSANWSPSGLKRQDNNAHFTSDRAQVAAFQQLFEQMWKRSDNERIPK